MWCDNRKSSGGEGGGGGQGRGGREGKSTKKGGSNINVLQKFRLILICLKI